MIFLDPTTDLAFKKLFANQAKKEIVTSFLNSVLGRQGNDEIVDVVITDPFNHQDTSWLKNSAVDVRCTDKNGKVYIVEMQVEDQADYPERSQYYTALAISRQLKPTEAYRGIKPVYFIGVLGFKLFENNNDYLSKHCILNTKTYEQQLKHMEFYFIELPKFDKTLEQLETVVDKWIYLLKNASNMNSIPKQLKNPVALEEAMDELVQATLSPAELAAYDRFLDQRRVAESVVWTAEEKVRRTIAQQLLAAKMASIDIARITGLSVEEIEKMR